MSLVVGYKILPQFQEFGIGQTLPLTVKLPDSAAVVFGFHIKHFIIFPRPL